MKKTVSLTVFEGYEVATIALRSLGKGAAEAVVTYGDGSTESVTSFVRVHDWDGSGERWKALGCSRLLKRGWRLDHAVNAFYDDRAAVVNAVKGSGYDKSVKAALLERLASR